jgi:hypothetical protein
MLQTQTFKFYPYQQQSITGPVLIAIFMLIACLGGAWLSSREIMIRAQLNTSGVTTQATVLDRDISSHIDGKGRRDTDYYLTYSFTAPDASGTERTYELRQSVNSTVYHQSTRSVTVLYLPTDPYTVRVKSISTDLLLTTFSGVFVVFCLSFAGVCAWLLLKIYQAGKLREDGKRLQGQIISAAGTTFKSKGQTRYSLTIEYEFVSPQGTRIQGQTTTERTDLLDQPLPERGTPIDVLYLNDKLYALD